LLSLWLVVIPLFLSLPFHRRTPPAANKDHWSHRIARNIATEAIAAPFTGAAPFG
jgi:hypothetical protein